MKGWERGPGAALLHVGMSPSPVFHVSVPLAGAGAADAGEWNRLRKGSAATASAQAASPCSRAGFQSTSQESASSWTLPRGRAYVSEPASYLPVREGLGAGPTAHSPPVTHYLLHQGLQVESLGESTSADLLCLPNRYILLLVPNTLARSES